MFHRTFLYVSFINTFQKVFNMFHFVFLLSQVHQIVVDPDLQLCVAWLIPAAIAASALIGGVSSYASSRNSARAAADASRETNAANERIAAETNRANLNLYREQFRDSLTLWNMENEYNSPSAQVARLRSAGLNPSLAMGSPAVSSSASLPSAAPAVGYTEQMPPSEAYSDTGLKAIGDTIANLGSSLNQGAQFQAAMTDNLTREEMGRKQLENLSAEIKQKLESVELSRVEKKRLQGELDSINLSLRLNEAKFDDDVQLSRLGVKYQEIQNRVLDESNARDAARLAIEQAESRYHIRFTQAQIDQVNTLTRIAVSTDWRDSQSHVLDMNLKALDESLKRLNLDSSKKEALFQDVMRNSEVMHSSLKDASLVNRLCERAFGLGFRDLGTALRTLITK